MRTAIKYNKSLFFCFVICSFIFVSSTFSFADQLFAPALNYYTGYDPRSITTGDFNGDGKADIATANYHGRYIAIQIGNGDGSFQLYKFYPISGNPISITSGDFNSDGKTDLVAIDHYFATVSVLIGNGDGTFQPSMNYPTWGILSVTTGDFNGDGKLDVATAGYNYVSIHIGNGDGTFQPCLNYLTGYSAESITTGDFNRDGKIDIATAGYYGFVSVLIGNGDGTFQAYVNYPPAYRMASITSGDFNGDGITDLATANVFPASVSVLIGNGDGTFRPSIDYLTDNLTTWSVTTGDFDNDGKTDLATANGDYWKGTVSVILGNGDGTFNASMNYPVGRGARSITLADFNNDGKSDLATANSWDNSISILLNISKKDTTPPVINLFATPNIIWPPDHKMRDIFIGGDATDAESGLAAVSFTITDEYGRIQPVISGFNTNIQLEAWRDGQDIDGRRYSITVKATDLAGNEATASTEILVPHDRRK